MAIIQPKEVIDLCGVVVNQVRRPMLSTSSQSKARRGKLDLETMAADLEKVGVTTAGGWLAGSHGALSTQQVVQALAAEAADHAERVDLESRERDEIEGLDRPTYELPFLAEGVDVASLYELADLLRSQGMA